MLRGCFDQRSCPGECERERERERERREREERRENRIERSEKREVNRSLLISEYLSIFMGNASRDNISRLDF